MTNVILHTTEGDITLKMYMDMPITAGNFIELAKKGFYDGLTFHRVIADFMIQGGCPKGNGTGGPGYTIPDEFVKGHSNARGTISMANSGPNSGGSQFFINVVNNDYLDWDNKRTPYAHPVFGEVADDESMAVVDKISNTQTGRDDKPVKEVKIVKAEVTDETPFPPKKELNDGKPVVVKLETTEGDVVLNMYSDMPVTAGNFVELVKKGFYDGIIFHRVIADFMIQGGCPKGNGTGGPGYSIPDEFVKGHSNARGTISMANSGPNSGGSQFFINVVNNDYLDWDNPATRSAHPVFGEVADDTSMAVVDKISKCKTGRNDKPVKDVKIVKATVISE